MKAEDFDQAFAAAFSSTTASTEPTWTLEEQRHFSTLFQMVGPDKNGIVSLKSALTLFSRSKLSQDILRDIWGLVDTERKGYFTQNSFYKALRLISAAQTGKTPSLAILNLSTPLPMFEGVPMESMKSSPVPANNTVPNTPKPEANRTDVNSVMVPTIEEKERYKATFLSCGPVDGYLGGDKARELFLKSGLPVDILGKIWTIVDTQGAGKLTMAQFMAAMFLISKIKFGQIQSVPTSVPPSVWTAFGNPTDNKRASTSMKPTTEIASPPKPQGHPILATLSSVPSNAEKAQYDQYFDTLDVGKKGFVTGGETYEFFLKSKLPEADLAKIWDLSDHLKAGKLNKEGFSVAMHLIKIRLAGNPLPTAGIAPPEPNFSASPMPASAIPAPSLNRAPTVISAASMPSPLLNRAPTVSSTSLLSDLMSFPTKPTSIPNPVMPSMSIPPNNTTRDFSSLEAQDLLEKERQLKIKKQEADDLQKQLHTLLPSSEEVKQRLATVEKELRTVTDQRHQLNLQYSQTKAVYEAEKAMLQDLDDRLDAEKKLFETAKQEFSQLERVTNELAAEKKQLTTQLEKLKFDWDDIQVQTSGYTENANQLKAQVQKLRAEVQDYGQKYMEAQQKLIAAQTEYQQTRNAQRATQAELEKEREKLELLNKELATQSSALQKEKDSLSRDNNSLNLSRQALESKKQAAAEALEDPFANDESEDEEKSEEGKSVDKAFDDAFPSLEQLNQTLPGKTSTTPPPLPPSSTKPKEPSNDNMFLPSSSAGPKDSQSGFEPVDFDAAFKNAAGSEFGLSPPKTDAFVLPEASLKKEDIMAAFDTGSPPRKTPDTVKSATSFDALFGAAAAKVSTPQPGPGNDDSEEVKQLISMGFTREKSLAALEK